MVVNDEMQGGLVNRALDLNIVDLAFILGPTTILLGVLTKSFSLSVPQFPCLLSEVDGTALLCKVH